MSFGASLGMNFINKGIDQFNYGVSQEYNRYAREKSRKWQMIDNQNMLSYRINDAKKHGIHPLAAIGVNPASGGIISGPSSQPPYGGGNAIQGSRDNDSLIKAQIRKLDAETNAINSIGQAPTVQKSVEQVGSQSQGIQVGENPQMKYDVTPEGFYNLIARDNEAYSDEAPITTQAQYLWDDVARRTAGRRLLHNWNDPKLAERKTWLLASRPKNVPPGYIALWNVARGQWQRVRKTSKNKDWIFNQEIPGRNLKGGKKFRPHNDSYNVY